MKKFVLLHLIVLPLFAQTLREYVLERGLRPVASSYEELLKSVNDPNNPITKEKIALGKKLFFDKNLSKDRSIACAKCHNLQKGGVDGKPTAIGYKNRANPKHLNSPTVFNTAYSKHLFWDGRAKSLREQAKGPMQASFEMASTPELIVKRVEENSAYHEMFTKAFGDETITFDRITKAIEAYEKTLITRSAYDDFLEGNDDALTAQQKHGLKLFIDLGCRSCHFGPAVGGQKLQKFPVRGYNTLFYMTFQYNEKTKKKEIYEVGLNFEKYHPFPFENIGGFMGKEATQYFRVPILRNVARTAPYFHNGAVKELREAIKIMAKYQLGLVLTPTQLNDLEAFLKSLNGELVDFEFEE